MSDFLFGSAPTESRVQDVTPQQFMNLRNPVSYAIQNYFRDGGAQYTGPYAAQMGAGEQQALGAVGQAAGQVGMQQPVQIGGGSQYGPQTGFNGAAFPMSPGLTIGGGQQTPQNILGGSFQFNPFAQLSGLEQQGVQNVTGQAFNPAVNQQLAQNILGQQIGGQVNPFAGAAGLSGAEQAGLGQIQQTAFGPNALQNTVNQQLGQIAGTGTHPQLQQLIASAQRPILEQFDDAALAQRGLYTGAGQQVQGQGSSPFAQASARLAGGVANALGDVATNVTAQLNAQQQQAQLAALGMAQQQPGLTLQNQLAGQAALGLPRTVEQLGLDRQSAAFQQMQAQQLGAAGLSDQLSSNALTRALAGLDAAGIESGRQGQAFESQQARQQAAGGQLGQQQLAQQQAQLQAQLSNLQAQALPRMIEQLGIQGGLAEFQRQQQMLLQMLGLGGNLAGGQPVVIPGSPGQVGAAQAFLGGLGGGLGGALIPG